jgi:hypothetical protein
MDLSDLVGCGRGRGGRAGTPFKPLFPEDYLQPLVWHIQQPIDRSYTVGHIRRFALELQ